MDKEVEEGELEGLFGVSEKNGVAEVRYMFNGFGSERNCRIIGSYLKGKYMGVRVGKDNV
ncbi:hypothetical protein [Bacillus thuringiensis]|uniref:hypothetical protein n=1 Tax=Bacillus thuringiensis TaxID=1428 RepID=UPI0021B33921|nr:hypothetical protein [Bacillus thuringiensis]